MPRDTAARTPARGTAPKGQPRPADAPTSFTVTEIALVLIAIGASIAVARIAEPFLVPVVMGILISYTLRPLVSALEGVRVPRFAAAALVITILVSLVGAAGYAIRDDVNDWVAELPAAARKLRHVVADSVRQAPGPVTNMKAAAEELDKAAAEASGKPVPAAEPAPKAGASAQFQDFIAHQSGQALGVVSELLVSLLLALFILSAGDTFRRKVAKLAGASLARRRVTIEVLNEIDAQIQAYMLTLLIANLLIALATWGALALLKLPNAGMLAAVTGVLHVVPYAGTVAAAVAVGVATFVETANVGEAIVAMMVIVSIAAAIGMGLATWMQGRTANMNPVAVFIGILFFGWLWGGWGLLLGVPILAVLKSIADRVEPMQPISEMLSP
ncbi:MAG: AI-2E family transporter [Betaproteobacteria bacterium]